MNELIKPTEEHRLYEPTAILNVVYRYSINAVLCKTCEGIGYTRISRNRINGKLHNVVSYNRGTVCNTCYLARS